jgi:hypothetical protein
MQNIRRSYASRKLVPVTPSQLRLPLHPLRKVTAPQSLHDLIDAVQDPLASLVRRQPLGTLHHSLIRLGPVRPILDPLPEPEDVRQDLGPHARLRAQARDGHERRQDPADGRQAAALGGVRQQRAVVAAEDVHGQVRVREREPRQQLVLEGPVHAVPQGAAARGDGGQARGRHGPRRRRAEPRRHGRRQARVEGVEAVDGAGDAVEGDALEAHLADELGRREGRQGGGGRGLGVEGEQGVRRVEGEC